MSEALTGLDIYEREDADREARTCSVCRVEAGSKRDNDEGRQTWWQWACDDMDLVPCSLCRFDAFASWVRKNIEHRVFTSYTGEQLIERAERRATS